MRKFYNRGETKMFNLASIGSIDANNDYGYIEFFINCLRDIINIIVNLFKGLPTTKEDDTTTTTAVAEK